MFPDAEILERRLKVFHRLPKVLPAVVVIHLDDIDFDMLETALDEDEWWRRLNCIVRRINKERDASRRGGE